LQMPLYVANIAMSIWSMVLALMLLFIINPAVEGFDMGYVPIYIGVVTFLFNYFFLIDSGRYLLDYEKYEAIDRKRALFQWVTIVIVYIIIVVVGISMGYKNRGEIMMQKKKKYELISRGMSRSKTVELLGEPKITFRSSTNSNVEILSYEIETNSGSVEGVDVYVNDSSQKVVFVSPR